MYVEDVDGNIYLDFTSGIGVNALGHAHPRILEAINRQAAEFIHMAGPDFYYSLFAEVCKELCGIVPISGEKKAFLCNSGTEAVEAAIKLARNYTRRPKIIAFLGAFHGRTMGSLSLTSSKAIHKMGFSPLVPDVIHVPYPNVYRPVFGADPARLADLTIEYIETMIFNKIAPPEDVACFVIECIQGEGGYIVAPGGFMKRLRQLCDKHGILLVVDEVQSGMGRTGKWWAFEHFGIEPDIVCIGKGVAAGVPMGATVSKASINRWASGAHSNTFGGNALACACALATIAEIKSSCLNNAADMGALLKSKLETLMDKYDVIGDVRGIGLMQGIEFVASKKSKAKAPELAKKVMNECFKNGLLLLTCGENTVRLIPSLIAGKEHIDECVGVLEEVVKKSI